jgi:hypothetical protein
VRRTQGIGASGSPRGEDRRWGGTAHSGSGEGGEAPMAPRAVPVPQSSLGPTHKERRWMRWAIGGER